MCGNATPPHPARAPRCASAHSPPSPARGEGDRARGDCTIPSQPSPRERSRQRAIRRFRWSILAPLILLLAFVLMPVLFLQLYFSFHQWTVYLGSWSDAEYVGLDLFREVLTDPRFGWAIVRSLVFATGSPIGCFVVGFALAYLMRRPFRGHAFYYTIFILLMLLELWNWGAFSFTILLPGLAAIPSEPIEAAEILGASRWRIFWEVELPLLRPVIFLALVLRFLEAMAEFPKTWALLQGGPGSATETLPVYIYLTTWQYFQISKGAALCYVAMILMIVIVLLAIRLLRREKHALDAM